MTKLREIDLTILVDNSPGREGLMTEHGFSCLVETEGFRVLLDTGARDALVHNSACLGISLGGLDAVVFSHGHYDHTGGLALATEAIGKTRIVAHRNILGPHRSRRTGVDRDIGMPVASRSVMNQFTLEFSETSIEVVNGIWTTGEIPRRTSEVQASGLYVDSAGLNPDPLLDDMALVLRHRAGLVVLLGCAHAGVIDTLVWVEQLFPGEPLLGVIGGMHLQGASPETIHAVVRTLKSSPVMFLAPGHCSGQNAMLAIQAAFGHRYHPMYVGMKTHLDEAGRFE